MKKRTAGTSKAASGRTLTKKATGRGRSNQPQKKG